jgi:copper chaperone
MKTIKISGMSCEHCVKAVTKALMDVDGIENISVSLEKGEASFDEVGPVDYADVKRKIEDAGYELES